MIRKFILFIKQLYYSFPIQLIILHFKRNHLLLLLWFLLFAFTAGWIAKKFGVMALFLYPEYLNISGWLSFLILGLSIGGFIVSFHLYSYILHGARFRFIATTKKPFLVFSYNNMIIPLLYIIFYLFFSYKYQIGNELVAHEDAVLNLLSFLLGLVLFAAGSYIYFIVTNKNFLSIKKADKMGAFQTTIHRRESWSNIQRRVQPWKVGYYLLPVFIVRIARDVHHYSDKWIDDIINQNHVNASIFELGAVLTFFLIGAFSNNAVFLIPAAASVFLFFTILLMIVSAFFSWMKGWTLTIMVIIILLLNGLSSETIDWLSIKSRAFGLDYNTEKVIYSDENISNLNTEEERLNDLKSMYSILDRRRNLSSHDSIMVIINVSGGGHRSSAWTFLSLFKTDSILEGRLYDNTYLIVGASGGMIGASYWREEAWRSKLKIDPYTFNEHFNYLTNDLLNPIIFTMVSNDFSFRFRKSKYKGVKYSHDRAFTFEDQLNKNTHGWFNVSLKEYRAKESNAEMPMVLFTPTILNDGRRLLISPLDLSFLSDKMKGANFERDESIEDIEFRSVFKEQNADELRYLSALRMNATFPYILPSVTLPSNPEMEVMDAGIRDNYGKLSSYEFLISTKDWVNKNIKKLVILQVRYKGRDFEPEEIDQSILSRISTPIGTIYGNFGRVQEYLQDDLMNELEKNIDADIEWIDFELSRNEDDPISLNFHLSGLEKKFILNAYNRVDNQQSLDRLKTLFENKD